MCYINLMRCLKQIETDGEAQVLLADRPFVVRKSFVDDAGEYDLEARIARLHRPLLIMHAPRDAAAGVENASRIFAAAKHPKSFISLDDADHLLTRRTDADNAATMIAAWAARYLPKLVADLPQVEDAEGGAAEETGEGLFQLAMRSGAHRFIADEPASVGGLGWSFPLRSRFCRACSLHYDDHAVVRTTQGSPA